LHGRLPLEVHEQVFATCWLDRGREEADAGQTVAVDSTTLEADAAMKTIVPQGHR